LRQVLAARQEQSQEAWRPRFLVFLLLLVCWAETWSRWPSLVLAQEILLFLAQKPVVEWFHSFLWAEAKAVATPAFQPV
jgi:hypothetical protein